MVVRDKFEEGYADIYHKYGYGTTVWGPLGSGVLSGRYNDGNIPEDSRYNIDPTFKDLVLGLFFSPDKKEKTVKALGELAILSAELGYTQAQLSLAWALANKNVSTLILGFSKTSYVDENLKALELYKKWTPEIEQRIEAILKNSPAPPMNFRLFRPDATHRHQAVFGKKLL
jgi:aryl-alcohol dehydrogenase-like predicted oxidoreductase